MTTVCLTMMVRDEAKVIRRCLASVLPLIDTFCIVDTGSRDGTQQIIRDFFDVYDVPGIVWDDPWIEDNYAANRNNVFDRARGKATYNLTIDADDQLEMAEGPWPILEPTMVEALRGALWPALTHDSYSMSVNEGNVPPIAPVERDYYTRVVLTKQSANLRYEGRIHETVPPAGPLFDWPKYRRIGGGARGSGREKFLRDAELLERVLREEPGNHRYQFYLGQSYSDANEHAKAVHAFYRRIVMAGGWEEETFAARVELAKSLERDGRVWAAKEAYLDAFASRPSRAEPLFHLARMLADVQASKAYVYARSASMIPMPATDTFLVERSVYEWKAAELVKRLAG